MLSKASSEAFGSQIFFLLIVFVIVVIPREEKKAKSSSGAWDSAAVLRGGRGEVGSGFTHQRGLSALC